MRAAPRPHVPLTEKQFQHLVLELATTFGWRHYHTHNSRRSPHGFPDLVLVRDHDRVIFAELKTDAGKLTDKQQTWIDALTTTSVETYVWRPNDLQQIAETFARRHQRKAA